MNLRGSLLCTVALVVFASAYALIRIALTELPPLTVGAVRFILASAFIVPVVFAGYRGAAWRFSKRELRVIVAMSGVVLLSTEGSLNNFAGSQFLGNLLQIGVAASYALSGKVGKVLLREHPPLVVVAAIFVVGGILLTICSISFEHSAWPSTVSTTVIAALLLLSLLYCVGLVACYAVLQRTGVFGLYVLLFLMPVLAVMISVVVLRESSTLLDVFFSGVTLLGVGITEAGKSA